MRRAALGLVVVVAAVALAGCTGGGGASSSGMAAGGAAGPAAATPSGAAPGAVTGTGPGAMSAATGGSGTPPADRAVVRTASISLRTSAVTDLAGVADRAEALATSVGGRVDSESRGDSAQLVLRVPAAALTSTLAALSRLGREVSRQIQGADVTATQADVGARVAALQTSVTRLEALISSSGGLDALLQVETQLTQRQGDLESLQAQQRALADQVALATITVDVTVPPPAGRTAAAAPAGFGHAVARGWDGFVLFLRYLVAGVGYASPVLVLLAVGALGGWAAVRRRRRGIHVTAPPAPDDAALGS